ncbi:hypothetical protein NDU88_005519, partial [Pleurodeles waltl]
MACAYSGAIDMKIGLRSKAVRSRLPKTAAASQKRERQAAGFTILKEKEKRSNTLKNKEINSTRAARMVKQQ